MSVRQWAYCCSVFAVVGLVATGCTKPSGDDASNATTHAAQDDHDDHEGHDDHGHPSEGPHGEPLIELGNEEYHAELVHDDATDTITIYMLDSSATKPVVVLEDAVTINAMIDGKPSQFKLTGVDVVDGTASAFEIVSEELHEAIEDESGKPRLNVAIDGKSFVGQIQHHDHSEHEHGDHDEEDHDADDHGTATQAATP